MVRTRANTNEALLYIQKYFRFRRPFSLNCYLITVSFRYYIFCLNVFLESCILKIETNHNLTVFLIDTDGP